MNARDIAMNMAHNKAGASATRPVFGSVVDADIDVRAEGYPGTTQSSIEAEIEMTRGLLSLLDDRITDLAHALNPVMRQPNVKAIEENLIAPKGDSPLYWMLRESNNSIAVKIDMITSLLERVEL